MLLKVFVSVLTLLNDCCQDSIRLQLLSEEIHIKSGETEISFDLKVTNDSSDSFLFYNFNSHFDLAFAEESFFCNDKIAAGTTIFVYNQKMEAIYARVAPIPDDISYQQVTDERVQQVIAEERVKFRNSLHVIKIGEQAVFTKKADLKNFRLAPGIYFIKLLYSAGDNTINMVTEDQMAEDRKKHNAEIFKGCINSNLVKLIVE